MSTNLHHIKGREDSDIYRDWFPWLQETADIYVRFLNNHRELFIYSPFNENEQSIVSLFQAGAAKAGYLSLMEVAIEKKKSRHGRTDLWLICGESQYWFEFKRTNFNPDSRSWGLRGVMESAINQANESKYDPDCIEVACVIGATNIMTTERRDTYLKFANEVDYSFRIGPESEEGSYIYFKILDRCK